MGLTIHKESWQVDASCGTVWPVAINELKRRRCANLGRRRPAIWYSVGGAPDDFVSRRERLRPIVVYDIYGEIKVLRDGRSTRLEFRVKLGIALSIAAMFGLPLMVVAPWVFFAFCFLAKSLAYGIGTFLVFVFCGVFWYCFFKLMVPRHREVIRILRAPCESIVTQCTK